MSRRSPSPMRPESPKGDCPYLTSQLKDEKADLEAKNRDLVREIQHLETKLKGINEKVTCFNEVDRDLAHHRQMLQDAEAARTSLQGHIDTTAVRVREAITENKRQQDDLIAANNALKRQLE